MRLSAAVRAAALASFLVCSAAAPAEAETLKQALADAYRNNPEIMSALLSVKATAEGIVQAKAGLLPSLSANASVGASFSAPSGGDFDTSFSAPKLGLSYSQTLFDNNRTDASVEAARAATEVSKYALRDKEQSILLSVAQAFYDVIRDTQLVQLQADNMKFYEAQLSSAQDRLRLGEGTRIDVSQAQARQAQAVAAYRSAVTSLQTSQAMFERYVGHKPVGLAGDFNFGKLLPGSLDTAITLAETQNPAILTARAAIRASQASVDLANDQFGPTLNLIGSICAVGCFGDFSTAGMSGSVSLSLSVPIYEGGRLGSGVRRANLNQIRSEVDALSTRDQVRQLVITTWSGLQNASAQIESAQSQVSASQLVVSGTIQERDVGQKTTLDVLNAQAELTSAQSGLISARAAKMIAAFGILQAVGRLSAEDLNLNVEVHSADGYIAAIEDVWSELRAIDEH
jgi:outer membrane protein